MSKPKQGMSDSTADFLSSLKGDASVLIPSLIEIDLIDPDPDNTRSTFRPVDGQVPKEALQALEEFADGILERKLAHPISVVSKPDGRYMIVMGERRWRSFVLNRDRGHPNFDRIPAVIREDLEGYDKRSERGLVQLAENLDREDVTDLDVARKLKELLEDDKNLQKQTLAALLRKPPSYVSKILAMMHPEWADVVNSGLITYASILEKYKALDAETRTAIATRAREEKRTINSKDITDAVARKKVGHDVQRDAASVLSAFAPTDEKYDPGHAAKSRSKADALQIADHGGAPVLPQGGAMEFAAPLAGRTSLTMTLAQVTMLASVGGFGEDEGVLGQRIHFALPADAIRNAIKTLGGKPPKGDAELVTSLMAAINAQF